MDNNQKQIITASISLLESTIASMSSQDADKVVAAVIILLRTLR